MWYHLFICSLLLNLSAVSKGDDPLAYYSRENCQAKGLLPKWDAADYSPFTHFEKVFKSPLNIDLIASAHSGNDTGFEQVTADWSCDFEPCYGTPCTPMNFFGPGAKDPKGGGCPKGPVRVFEDLTCAIKLGLLQNPKAFEKFCDTSSSTEKGTFECLAFFANVITETGAFAETEERDPRPYCWNRSGDNVGDCCPAADHKKCLDDSDAELADSDYPKPNKRWLTNELVNDKCCSYHGRGFLQVSYEPNYRALSKALLNDEKILWHYPYKLDSDGVMGWSAALWFWFNQHPAQVATAEGQPAVHLAPRDILLDYKKGGFPGTIAVINGGECDASLDKQKALARISYFFAIAHRMNAKPILEGNEKPINYYPLPGTAECAQYGFCKYQFLNDKSICPILRSGVDCAAQVGPYVAKVSTPMGWNRQLVKLTKSDGGTPVCQLGSQLLQTPYVWARPQSALRTFQGWESLLDVTAANVCDRVKLYYEKDGKLVEGNSKNCHSVCWHDFSWETSNRGVPCEQPARPCLTMVDYLTHPLPEHNWESGNMGGYKGGEIIGRVGPGLVQALNGPRGFPDHTDGLCYHFGASPCFWNVGMGCSPDIEDNTHGCRYIPAGMKPEEVQVAKKPQYAHVEDLEGRARPKALEKVLSYYDKANCPMPKGETVLEQILPKGPLDIDRLFSVHYSQSDGFANKRFDDDDPSVNEGNVLFGKNGPQLVWDAMLCAFNLGVPNDPNVFKKAFGLQVNVANVKDVPSPLNDDQKKFALLEFIAFAANVIKETGALAQAEEQHANCECTYQGGQANPCCPNDWGNNPPCSSGMTSEDSIMNPEALKNATTVHATCCSVHGRGFLQTSYERNYGDLGEFMFESEKYGIGKLLGRQLMLNYPQAIDSFGITGWTAAFAFWLHKHPCQYCEGRNTTTLDWNAAESSPHDAMQKYKIPGQGLGRVFTIINGVECEAAVKHEKPLADHGSQMRLSLFYNLAYRFNVSAPGESDLLPLPGTLECDKSAWCRGTFLKTAIPVASYRKEAGGCWALTPQPLDDDKEVWTWCRADQIVKGTTKWGATIETVSFSLKHQSKGECTLLREFSCGSKIIDKKNKPSMYTHPELKPYTQRRDVTPDYQDPFFLKLRGLGADELCQLVVDEDPTNNLPPVNQGCGFWCATNSGARSCSSMNPENCELRGLGSNFVRCANEFFQTVHTTKDCKINVTLESVLPDFSKAPTLAAPTGGCQVGCSECVSADESSRWANCARCKNGEDKLEWPCNNPPLCKCAKAGAGTHPPVTLTTVAPAGDIALSSSVGGCQKGCKVCKSVNGYNDPACARCADGQNKVDWPCGEKGDSASCKCIA